MKTDKISFRIDKLGNSCISSSLTEKQSFIEDSERVRMHLRFSKDDAELELGNLEGLSFEKSGPRKQIYFNPETTKAAIVTCGGLCPGLNAVIRGLVRQLYNRYGVKNIVGIRYGYHGLGNAGKAFIQLNNNVVEDIHYRGGTILGASRGTPEKKEIVENLVKHNINILFTIGGDGTMKGAYEIAKEVERLGLKISIIGIPKTIDNDIPYVMQSFGFETAVEKATDAVLAAHEEARGHSNGIGLVKLMGRSTGFIAANASISTGVVNLCLVPEIPFSLEGKEGIYQYLKERFKKKSHAVIIAAEGAGQELISKQKEAKDASGNVIFEDIGKFLQENIKDYFEKEGKKCSLKYIDPSYIVRSAAPNCFDRVFCARLAQNAVHAAMAGKTAMLIGYWHGVMTHVPFKALSGQTKKINPNGTLWFNVLESTSESS